MRFAAVVLPSIALGALGVLGALGAVAHADEPDYSQYTVEARPHVKAAIAAFGKADYVASVREWEAAYAIDRNPQLLYSWAQAERFAKRCGLAIDHYRQYLAYKLTDNQIAAARGGIAMCLETIDKATCDASPGGARDRPPPPSLAAPPWYRAPAVNATIGGAAGIGVGVGIGFLIAASASRDRANHAQFSDEFDADLDEATGRRRIGITALTLGIALGGVGVALILHDRSADHITVSASAGAGAAALVIGGPL